MGIGRKLTKACFDLVYNPVYDFTTAGVAPYRRLQRLCVDKLDARNAEKVLCVGVGTGNEILRLQERNGRPEITGIDTSPRALRIAYRKARRQGAKVRLFRMDASRLEFEDESFDKVLCLHVMDFVEDSYRVTGEIVRVLKREGRFVITYPSAGEGLRLGINVLKESLRDGASSFSSLLKLPAMFIAGGIAYSPLLLRGKRKSYSLSELEAMYAALKLGEFGIEEYQVYQDFIVCGRK